MFPPVPAQRAGKRCRHGRFKQRRVFADQAVACEMPVIATPGRQQRRWLAGFARWLKSARYAARSAAPACGSGRVVRARLRTARGRCDSRRAYGVRPFQPQGVDESVEFACPGDSVASTGTPSPSAALMPAASAWLDQPAATGVGEAADARCRSDAMAGHQQRKGLCRRPAHSAWRCQLLRQLAIGARFSCRDAADGMPTRCWNGARGARRAAPPRWRGLPATPDGGCGAVRRLPEGASMTPGGRKILDPLSARQMPKAERQREDGVASRVTRLLADCHCRTRSISGWSGLRPTAAGVDLVGRDADLGPRPYSKPSAKRVEALIITDAESTSRRKRIAVV